MTHQKEAWWRTRRRLGGAPERGLVAHQKEASGSPPEDAQEMGTKLREDENAILLSREIGNCRKLHTYRADRFNDKWMLSIWWKLSVDMQVLVNSKRQFILPPHIHIIIFILRPVTSLLKLFLSWTAQFRFEFHTPLFRRFTHQSKTEVCAIRQNLSCSLSGEFVEVVFQITHAEEVRSKMHGIWVVGQIEYSNRASGMENRPAARRGEMADRRRCWSHPGFIS